MDEKGKMMKAEVADQVIRMALKSADKQGKLRVVAAVTGIAGGESELRKLMNGSEPLSIMDRGMLGCTWELGASANYTSGHKARDARSRAEGSAEPHKYQRA